MKRILDVCCGSRMFYFDKNNPDVIYADNRELETTLCDGRLLLIKPDVHMDFRNMPYENNTFKLVVFDPPHLIHAGTVSWLANKYGILPKEWKPYLKAGFDECMRVLEENGLLVFKWNEIQIPFADVIKVFGQKPLLGDKRGNTRWVIFIKQTEKNRKEGKEHGKYKPVKNAWEPVVNAHGELTEFICDCGCSSQAASNYCPDCGTKMDNSDIEERIEKAVHDAI